MDAEYYTKLLDYCQTDTQSNHVMAIIAHGGVSPAARALKIRRTALQESLKRIKKHAALRGFDPERDLNYPLPAPQIISGTSTLIDKATGLSRLQWVKTKTTDEEWLAAMKCAVDAYKEDLPRYGAIPQFSDHCDSELLSCYVITDYHMGMKADGDECDEDYDVRISEDLLVKWFGYAIQKAPASKHAVLAQIGDFLHSDGFDALTPQSKHLLDVDTRFQKTIRAAIRVIRRVIDMLLEKHEHVTVLMCTGNHDIASSAWLRELLPIVYECEPRVTVNNSLDSYYYVEHGNTSLFFHHGHRRKMESVDDVFVAKFREVFGRTKHSYAHMGHYHHNKSLETNLMQVEQHRTLAPKDSYATHGGWIAGRDAKVITYHSKFGEAERITISPAMLA